DSHVAPRAFARCCASLDRSDTSGREPHVAASQPSSPGEPARPGPHGSAASRRGSRRGSLVPVAIVVLGLVELAILVLIGINTSLWWAVLAIAVGWVIGIALLVAAGQQSFVRLRSLV